MSQSEVRDAVARAIAGSLGGEMSLDEMTGYGRAMARREADAAIAAFLEAARDNIPISAVRQVCSYLGDGECVDCEESVETPYGPGTPGCFALAEEAIERVLEALAAAPESKRDD